MKFPTACVLLLLFLLPATSFAVSNAPAAASTFAAGTWTDELPGGERMPAPSETWFWLCAAAIAGVCCFVSVAKEDRRLRALEEPFPLWEPPSSLSNR
ncbi:MAG: hypothetical protein HY360_14700 [Verrucomicrobia bacterium]|nr:hypothetical protein [Verrucomicrobiota bacterium]